MKAALYVDLKRCIGCNSCSVACKQEYNVPAGNKWMEVYGAEKEDYPRPSVQVLPMTCQQCEDAPCKKKCDELGYLAIKRRPDGIVYVDPQRCVGCQKCIPVCPYKVMNFNAAKKVAEKCNFCMERLDAGKLPACVVTCVGVTLEFGDYDALKLKYPKAEGMGDHVRVLYGRLGDEPEHPTSGYPDPVPFHEDD